MKYVFLLDLMCNNLEFKSIKTFLHKKSPQIRTFLHKICSNWDLSWYKTSCWVGHKTPLTHPWLPAWYGSLELKKKRCVNQTIWSSSLSPLLPKMIWRLPASIVVKWDNCLPASNHVWNQFCLLSGETQFVCISRVCIESAKKIS